MLISSIKKPNHKPKRSFHQQQMLKLTIYLVVVLPLLLGAIACFLAYHFSRVR